MKKYKYILLDLDNTLYDTRSTERLAIREMIHALGRGSEESDLIKLYRRINYKAWEKLETGSLKISELNKERFAEFLTIAKIDYDPERAADEYLKLLAKNHLFLPDAQTIYEYLTENYAVALITNGLKKAQILRIQNSFIDISKSPLYTGEDLGIHKPDPEVVELISKDLHWNVGNSMILIGDSLRSDVQCAINAGIDCIWCNFTEEKAEHIEPEYEVNSLIEIKEIL